MCICKVDISTPSILYLYGSDIQCHASQFRTRYAGVKDRVMPDFQSRQELPKSFLPCLDKLGIL
jgi:hypothetical protein